MELKDRLKIYRLSEDEYSRICNLLSREPQGIEWALFSALWSEHCSYKSSKTHLKKLFNKSHRVMVAFGENAGVVDIGLGEKICFKMESHNHPSFIEPYQGAATGVGGILRDIFTMGARPIALANYLCFGSKNADRMQSLIKGVVGGIGGYGNCVGVPTITGQTEFHESYNQNILVNALAVGLFQEGDPIFLSKATGDENYVVYVGAKTGRDGVHGASMASESFDEESESKRPTVQIGDPFYEKLLIESCLEVMKQNLVVAIQDMGAAGLISSSFEMAAKGGVGIDMHLDQVPLRDSSITPEEVLLSESQERMLLVCEPDNFIKLQSVFHHWGLDATIIGKITNRKKVRIFWHDELLTDIDPDYLVDEAPEYKRPFNNWEQQNRVKKISLKIKNAQNTLLKILNSEAGCSREWVYQHYDQRVGAQTARDCTSSIGVVRLPQTKRALGLVLGCRPYLMRFDVAEGAKDSVALCALELASKGFEPLAVTDCLNFGNPEKIEIMTELVATTRNMSKMCETLNTPIISGNVSLYNETDSANITSTPAIGMAGLRRSVEDIPQNYFTHVGSAIYLLEEPMLVTGGQTQEWLQEKAEGIGEISVTKAAAFVLNILEISQLKGVECSKPVGKFGLAYQLARMCKDNIGCETEIIFKNGRFKKSEDLFLEYLYQVLFVVSSDETKHFEAELEKRKIEFKKIGTTKMGHFKIDRLIDLKVEDVAKAYDIGWEENFGKI